jgi:hypothetical protein
MRRTFFDGRFTAFSDIREREPQAILTAALTAVAVSEALCRLRLCGTRGHLTSSPDAPASIPSYVTVPSSRRCMYQIPEPGIEALDKSGLPGHFPISCEAGQPSNSCM